jgi:hypothetical protein
MYRALWCWSEWAPAGEPNVHTRCAGRGAATFAREGKLSSLAGRSNVPGRGF